MKILPLRQGIVEYLEKRGLQKKFEKQKSFFEKNIFYPSLATELLEPKEMCIWSFRIDQKYRVIFIFRDKNAVEIIDVNNHYQ